MKVTAAYRLLSACIEHNYVSYVVDGVKGEIIELSAVQQ